jgi:diamine N-acetyltransferase
MDGLSLRALEPEDLDLLMRWEADHVDAGLRVSPYSRAVLSRYLEESHRDFWDAGQVRFVLCDPSGSASRSCPACGSFYAQTRSW